MFDALEPGDPRQVGRYRIVARIGAGGMGQVYLGRSPGGRPVAIKVVRPELARDGDFRRRFAREVTAARRVNGAFTAGVVDADPDASPAWLATLYVSGVSLADAVAEHGPWPARPVLALGAGLAEALEAIHAAGVVHRDLKPSNVLLASDGPRVIDFGISTAGEASALTHTGVTIGTPGFMSPEQLTGRPIGPASDVFALGAVLAYTGAGVGPFGTGTPHALHFRAVYEEPDLDALPAGLRELVAACLAKDPDERPSVADLLERMTAPGPNEAADATLVLSEPDWMPDAVDRLVRARSATSLPRAPHPAADAGSPDPAATPTAPDVPAAPPEPPPPVHEAATRTADHAARGGTPGPATPAAPAAAPEHDPAGPTPAVLVYPAGIAAPMSRRGALLALTGTAVAAGVGFAFWRNSEGGSGSAGSPSATQPTTRKPSPTTPAPPRKPGQQLWAFRTEGEVHTTPTVADGVVYIGSNDGSLYAVDAATGRKRWSVVTGSVVYSSAAVANGVVYVGTRGNGLYALDAATGKRRWAFAPDAWAMSTPVVVDGVVYLGSSNDHFYAVDAATGKQKWNFPCQKDGMVDAAPAVVDGVVYFGSDDNHLYALDAATGRKRWAFPTTESVDVVPVVANGTVYVSSRRLYAVNAATGTQRWSMSGAKYKIAGAGYRHLCAPTVADGVVYVGDEIDNVFAVDAAKGTKRWTFRTGDSVFAAPAVADQVVYAASEDHHLYALDAKTGKRRWAFATGAGLENAPTVAGGVVYVGSKDSSLYAVQR